MGTLHKIADGLINAITGVGTGRDARSASTYVSRPLTQIEIGSAYSGSGLIRKICQIPALDMVREWRDWKIEAVDIGKIEDAEKLHGIRAKVQQAEVLRAMGGGALILGLPGNPSEPAPEPASKALAFVHVVSRWHLTFDGLQDDATLPGYGEPSMWKLSAKGGTQTIHPSRVIPWRADTTASLAMPATWSAEDAFWGESTVQQVLEAVTDSDTARAAFAGLMHKARLLRIGIPNLMQLVSTTTGEANLQKRLAAVVMAESLHNATIFDAGDPETGKGGEEIADATYSFAGAKDILNAYAEFVAAIADIPATRLLGRAPDGMNSSGDSQQKDWNKKVRAMQTLTLAPCLDRLDRYLVGSALGTVPEGAWYDFTPLDLPSEADEATRFKTTMEAAEKLQATATIPETAFTKAMQNLMSNEGWLPGIDEALAEIPEDERFGIEPDMETGMLGPDGSTIQQTALNGAQVTSLSETVLMVERGEIDRETAFNLVRIAFPAVAETDVRALLAKAGDNPRMKSDPVNNGKEGDPSLAGQGGSIGSEPPDLANDAAPRTLYVSRPVLNRADLQAWADEQGLGELQPDLHVTIAHSRQPIDWMTAQEDWPAGDNGELVIQAGGPRLVEPLGDRTAVLLFASSHLSYRHERIKQAGASWDYSDYQPHVSLTGEAVDLAGVEPYRGIIRLGPERFEELREEA